MARVHHRHRDRILARDKHRCLLCGATSNLDVHHVKSQKQGGSSADDNLATLCAGCHIIAVRSEINWPVLIAHHMANG